jgi:hypothetical protein
MKIMVSEKKSIHYVQGTSTSTDDGPVAIKPNADVKMLIVLPQVKLNIGLYDQT